MTMGAQFEIKKVALDITKEVRVEIGSGKGQFITALAKDFPDIQFVAIEKDIDVCYRIAEKKMAYDLKNVWILNLDAMHLEELFDASTIDLIYLNFSDPWPKKKHHKRRLSAPKFSLVYQRLLKPAGMIQLRTDHDVFFKDSIDTLSVGFDIIDIQHDYPQTPYMTEYEEKKRPFGPIYQLRGTKKHDSSTLS